MRTKRQIVIIGEKYRRLCITAYLGVVKYNSQVIAICECGTSKQYRFMHIKNGNVKSCGCLNKEMLSARATHGLRGHPLYYIYNGMMQRCYYSKNISYKNYGGRGVTVCAEWRENFISFYNWAISNGWNDKDRLDLDKDKLAPNGKGVVYCPEFCSFITRKENCKYRRGVRMVTYENKTQCLSQWCEDLNLDLKKIICRLYRKWTPERAFSTL